MTLRPLARLALALLLPAIAIRTAATPFVLPAECPAATLAAYQALGSTGCSVGILRFNDFDFAVLAFGGGAIPITAADILITPSVTPASRASLLFSSAGFAVTGTQFVDYLIAYTADPHPEIFDFAIGMTVASPVFPGIAQATSDLCIGTAFAGAICPATSATLTVFHNGITSTLTASTSFTPVAVLGVRNTISLDANGASADFSSLENQAGMIPEPATLLLVGLGLTAGALLNRRRR